MKGKIVLFLLSISVLDNTKLVAQSIPVGTPVLEEYYRRSQVLGVIDSNVSFTIRPIVPASALEIENGFKPENEPGPGVRTGSGYFKLLPLIITQQYNSKIPFGWNDGGMIPSRGYQGLISGGVYFSKGILSVQVQPQMIYAENKEFEGFPSGYPDFMWSRYYEYYYGITDAPVRYGNKPYNRF